MKYWEEYLDIEDVWEAIYDTYILGKGGGLLNELDIYKKWIPRFNKKFREFMDKMK